ncbi:MAG: SUMF1/EgtB/PvdO family nonheme iron enzyme [Thermodesulfobacteriota bacterium]|nr:SUMF1/EgtB/PvdO family nonheme iron enzyme [Thermodesulfobacteriota bacterium]
MFFTSMGKRWWIIIAITLIIMLPLSMYIYLKAKTGKIEGMAYISSGEFLKGGERARSINKVMRYPEKRGALWPEAPPKLRTFLSGFYIDKYEITNGQYLEFITSTGHRPPVHWKDGIYPIGKQNFPVVNVSFRDAQEYAAWAGKRLPTEDEWEKAAAGRDGRMFPWGNEFDVRRTNTWESGIRKPTEVDKYEEGKSPYGVLGMGGNVMEWTGSWGEFPNDNLIVIKGGSWATDAFDARLQSRVLAATDIITNGLGFRCAYSPLSDLLTQRIKTLLQ